MAEEQSSKVQAPTTTSNSRTPSGQAQVVRMSLRPPSRFSAGTDLVLWRKRFELYARQARIAEDQWTGEVLSLLDDEPFRLVTQQGFDGNSEYSAVLKCLMDQYNPEGSGSLNSSSVLKNLKSACQSTRGRFEHWLTKPIQSGRQNS